MIPKGCDTFHKYHKLCEQHFEPKYISKGGSTRKTLFEQAVPTLFGNIPKRPPDQDPDSQVLEPPSKIIALTGKLEFY